MAWPSPSDYQDAVQNPSTTFADPRLRSAQAALGPLGLPKVASGNYCSVYEFRSGQRRWAVRCFNRQVPDAERRYRTIDEHLNRHPLPWIVGFDFVTQGIRVRGQWYPIVVMDWVEGVTLSRYLEKRVRDSAAVRALADQWPQVMAGLRSAGIAHGDLQHGNILVAQDQIRLVDYDNLFVPAFQGEPSPELGRLHYQHPGRTPDDFDLEIANFSALVIYLSLRALAVDPSLWRSYNGENLVLTADDYKRPATSATLAQMRASRDPVVGRLAAELARCAALPVSQVPPLEDVLASAGIPSAHATAPRPTAPPAAAPPDWTTGPGTSSPRSRPAPSRPAPAPPRQPQPPAGGRWWEEAETPPAAPAPPRPQPRSRRSRRPDWMASSRRQAPSGAGGAIALPQQPPALGLGGCLATVVRSCLILLMMAALVIGGIAWWAYRNWEQIGPMIEQAPVVLPRDRDASRPLPETRAPGSGRPARPLPQPERQPPGSVPRPRASRPEATPVPPGPPTRTQPESNPATPQNRPPAQSPRPAGGTSTPRSLALLDQGISQLRSGDPEGALSALLQARPAGLRLGDPAVARRYYAALAEAHYGVGEYIPSLGAFREALRLDPKNERLRKLYQDALSRLGSGQTE